MTDEGGVGGGEGGSPPSSPVQDPPEWARLVLASILAAALLHLLLADRTEAATGFVPATFETVGGAVGGAPAEDDGRNDADDNEEEGAGVVVPDDAATDAEDDDDEKKEGKDTAKKKKKKAKRNDVRRRDYDLLVTPIEETAEYAEEREREARRSAREGAERAAAREAAGRAALVDPVTKNVGRKLGRDGGDDVQDSSQPSIDGNDPMELKSQARHPGLQGYYEWQATMLSEDGALPEPLVTRSGGDASAFSAAELGNAVEWSCRRIRREEALHRGRGVASAKLLLRYLKNMCLHPADPKYRRLRLSNDAFRHAVYDTGARGILLALGFEELDGYMECGPGGGRMLGAARIQQISDAMVAVDGALKAMEDGGGEDGSGGSLT